MGLRGGRTPDLHLMTQCEPVFMSKETSVLKLEVQTVHVTD